MNTVYITTKKVYLQKVGSQNRGSLPLQKVGEMSSCPVSTHGSTPMLGIFKDVWIM